MNASPLQILSAVQAELPPLFAHKDKIKLAFQKGTIAEEITPQGFELLVDSLQRHLSTSEQSRDKLKAIDKHLKSRFANVIEDIAEALDDLEAILEVCNVTDRSVHFCWCRFLPNHYMTIRKRLLKFYHLTMFILMKFLKPLI